MNGLIGLSNRESLLLLDRNDGSVAQLAEQGIHKPAASAEFPKKSDDPPYRLRKACATDALADPALSEVVKAWPTLPAPIKAVLLALIRTSSV